MKTRNNQKYMDEVDYGHLELLLARFAAREN